MIISQLVDVKGAMFSSDIEVHYVGKMEDIPDIAAIDEYILNHTIRL